MNQSPLILSESIMFNVEQLGNKENYLNHNNYKHGQ